MKNSRRELFNFMPKSFQHGELFAMVQMQGFMHSDLHKDNIIGNTIIDYGGMYFFNFPYDLLDEEKINKLTICLMPMLRQLDFEDTAWFRLGYICQGGILSDIIFNNLSINKNVYSNILDNSGLESIRSIRYMTKTDCENLITWKKIDFKQIIEIPTHRYGKFKVRKKIGRENAYFLDLYYFTLYYYLYDLAENGFAQLLLLYNLAQREYAYMNFSLAFGFAQMYLKKFKSLSFENEDINNLTREIEEMVQTIDLFACEEKLINQIVFSNSGFAQLIWMLDDVEHSVESHV